MSGFHCKNYTKSHISSLKHKKNLIRFNLYSNGLNSQGETLLHKDQINNDKLILKNKLAFGGFVSVWILSFLSSLLIIINFFKYNIIVLQNFFFFFHLFVDIIKIKG